MMDNCSHRNALLRHVFVLCLIATCGATLLGCGGLVNNAAADNSAQSINSSDSGISRAQALQTAMDEIQVKDKDITFLETHCAKYKGKEAFKIVVETAQESHVIWVSAEDGSVLRVTHDEISQDPEVSTERKISIDEAKDIALEARGVSASEVSFIRAELDEEDGTAVWEIEFDYNSVEYEYRIDATTGQILAFS